MGCRMTVRIRCDRSSRLALPVMGCLVLLVCSTALVLCQPPAVASGPHAALAALIGPRRYYLTQLALPTGGDAAEACADWYHMASLWEILDTSNLRYNTTLGLVSDDSGQGPPTAVAGWVRTGYGLDWSQVPGEGNCRSWASGDAGDYGTYAELPSNWTGGSADVHVWAVSTGGCDEALRVWCVQDPITAIYLPLVVKNYQ